MTLHRLLGHRCVIYEPYARQGKMRLSKIAWSRFKSCKDKSTTSRPSLWNGAIGMMDTTNVGRSLASRCPRQWLPAPGSALIPRRSNGVKADSTSEITIQGSVQVVLRRPFTSALMQPSMLGCSPFPTSAIALMQSSRLSNEGQQ